MLSPPFIFLPAFPPGFLRATFKSHNPFCSAYSIKKIRSVAILPYTFEIIKMCKNCLFKIYKKNFFIASVKK